MFENQMTPVIAERRMGQAEADCRHRTSHFAITAAIGTGSTRSSEATG